MHHDDNTESDNTSTSVLTYNDVGYLNFDKSSNCPVNSD